MDGMCTWGRGRRVHPTYTLHGSCTACEHVALLCQSVRTFFLLALGPTGCSKTCGPGCLSCRRHPIVPAGYSGM